MRNLLPDSAFADRRVLHQAPLSIVLTALSTAAGVAVTPLLAFWLLGTRLPVDVSGMALSIAQIVLAPVTAGACGARMLQEAAELHLQISGCVSGSCAVLPVLQPSQQ